MTYFLRKSNFYYLNPVLCPIWGLRAAAPLLSTSLVVKLTGPGSTSPVATQAAARYQPLLRGAGSAAGLVNEVTVEIQGESGTLGQGTNYSYALAWPATTAAVITGSARSPFGMGYAMETLLQLATPKAQLDCGGGFTVLDTPDYPHRGILLDTGRRFFPLGLLKSTVDAMAMFKLNVLHLHLNEDRFRVESKVFPQLNQPQNCSESGYVARHTLHFWFLYQGARPLLANC